MSYSSNALGFLVALGCSVQGAEYSTITDRQVDLQLVYVGGALSGSLEAGSGLLERSSTLLYDGPDGTTSTPRPAGAEWDFLGVAAGEPVYYWPQGSEEDRIYAGFASDKGTVPGGTFQSYFESDPRVSAAAAWNKITLVDVRFQPAPGESPGPAYFSLWQNDFDGNTTVWMSSFEDGITGADAAWLLQGGHEHFNFGFSKRGYYQIDFRFSGYVSGGALVQSDALTYHFGVEHLPEALVIPEPCTLLLLLGSSAAAATCRFRRARSVGSPACSVRG